MIYQKELDAMDRDSKLCLRIQELEAEVKQLKDMLPEEKQPRRAMCPKEVAEKHGGLMKKGKAWEYNHFPFMAYNDLMGLSRIIRRCCFLREKRLYTYSSADSYSYRSKEINCDTAKTLKELTDEEYNTYCTVLDKVLDVFQEYGCTLNNNWY